MKYLIISGMIVVAAEMCLPQLARSQGTLYVSSLGSSVATGEVASDSWLAAIIGTGSNPAGYVLDSVQLEMAAASGTPSGFTVQLYNMSELGPLLAHEPGTSLATLSGTSDPASAGVYTFVASGVTLAPETDYAIVLTDTTLATTGFFAWGLESPFSNNLSGGWGEGGVTFEASDGSSWTEVSSNDPQLAVTATAVPEPNTFGLLVLSGLTFFAWPRWRSKEESSVMIS